MITKGKVVSIEYILKNESGEILEESSGTPLNYLHGYKNIVVGLEKDLEGLSIGDKKTATVPPETGYGDYEAEKVFDVPKANFGEGLPEIGQFININSPEGTFAALVKEIKDTSITLDVNHPMAGTTLFFEIEVKDIRDATEDEVTHGHVHGPGCNH